MNLNQSISVIILAAGKGTRMKSNQAKVLHEAFFLPMLHHVTKAVEPLAPVQTVIVVGHQHESVKRSLAGFKVTFALQTKQIGTGHAVLAAEQSITDNDSTILILCGDTPLIRSDTLADMCNKHFSSVAALTLMTTMLDDPTNYGRILSDMSGDISGIVEQKDASPEQLQINEINAGIYCVNGKFLFESLKKVGTENSQGEVYLTDIVALAVKEGLKVERFITADSLDVLGVNCRIELAKAHQALQARRNRELMLEGVTLYSPETTLISKDSSVGLDTTISAGVTITDTTMIGKSCTIGQGAILKNCDIGDNVNIGPYCCLTDTILKADTTIEKDY